MANKGQDEHVDFEPAREWIIQRCVNAYRNEYEDSPGFCERLMTREEMMVAISCGRFGDAALRSRNGQPRHVQGGAVN